MRAVGSPGCMRRVMRSARAYPMIARRLMFGVALVATCVAVRAEATAPVDRCAVCHGTLADRRLSAPVQLFSNDVHRSRGFGCAACHGGEPGATGKEAMDPAARLPRQALARTDSCRSAARCHADAQFMRRYNPSLRVDQVGGVPHIRARTAAARARATRRSRRA